MKLNLKAFALAWGILWALDVFLMTWWSYLTGGGKTLGALSRFYIGYSVTPGGSIVGLVYGFVNGLVAGAIFAWVYNSFVKEK